MNLDGKDDIKPTPFDHHEQTVRGVHVPTTMESPDIPVDSIAEYPKAVAHDEKTGEPTIVNSREEEEAYNASKKEA